MKEKIEIQIKNYEWLLGSINSADVKAGYLFGLDLAMLAVFISESDNLISESPVTSCWLFVILTIVASVCLLISLFWAVKTILPRLRKESHSIFYFKSINVLDKDEYNDRVNSLTEDDLAKDLNNQIYIISQIAEIKFKNVKFGFIFFIIAFIIVVLVLITS